ncbi:hypothetical protein DOTSEDRAFT_119905 [Dothistroma septosporum NZE10]|uniref:Heme peroxidase n=1 Tax=Dothistroma septosporum (strain NZE10 / CBS 128990) TaxID=675120 RepID=N1Q2X2_DOTSN|nr:hypothetical protein DOTSEDRAFT_119905 [Dothistroma septosporum NZE10]
MAPGIKTIIGHMKRKPSSAPDRKSGNEAAAAPTVEKTSLVHDLTHLNIKNAKVLASALPALASGDPLDDKDLMLENGVAMLQSLPANSGLSAATSDAFIKMLYHDLPHPSTTMAGPTAKYRRHDGGNNNPWNPEMGKAGTPYARNVPPSKPKGPNLPDPELVFEQLMKRKGPFREHPSGLNRLFFSFATIVIHECFQTRRGQPWINETSSYVDLSTLYGNTEVEQKRVRTYNNGLIYPDSIASERIMLMPPGVVALLVLFSRNHNSIAESLLSINEEGKYKPWESLSKEDQVWQDNDIFQVARNINVGFFATVVLKDYVAAILNTPRANSTWSLDLGKEIKSAGQRVERGTGNVVSTEFAVLYHWHAALSAADDQWMEAVLRRHVPELKSLDDMTTKMFYERVMGAEGGHLMSLEPRHWTFGGLERDETGRFNDVQLGELIKDCVNEPAHAFGAHGTPASLKVVDILGQMQARNQFNVCTMNEFRRYLNLKAYASFEEWNPDKETARAAELLYGHIDNLELYPGLMAECTKPAIPGSGVCPGQTTGRGILDDAVALVRGDRYLSYDFNSNTLSNWGISKLGDVPGGTYGGMLPHLLFTGLPNSFTGTSPYALLPFYTPKAAKGILEGNKAVAKYDLVRPPPDGTVVGIHTRTGIKAVLEDVNSIHPLSLPAVERLSAGRSFMFGFHGAQSNKSSALQKVFFENGFEENVSKFFQTTTARLIKQCSLKYSSMKRSIDVVRDITNVAPIMWLANRFAIPLKTQETPKGLVTLPRLFDMYLALFFYSSFNVRAGREWKLRENAEYAASTLGEIHEAHLKTQQGVKEHIVDWLAKGSAYEVGPDADRIYKALLATKQPIPELAGDCLGIGATVAGIITQQASLLIDLFLKPDYEQYKKRIIELSHMDDAASNKELQGFVFEGMRHASVIPGVPLVANKDTVVQDGGRGAVNIRANQKVLIAASKAAMDPQAFPNPEQLDPHRPFESYTLLGHGPGARVVGPAIAGMLKEIFKLGDLGRAAGRLGQFSFLEYHVGGTTIKYYLDANSAESPMPTTLTLEYFDRSASTNGLTTGVAQPNGTAPYKAY